MLDLFRIPAAGALMLLGLGIVIAMALAACIGTWEEAGLVMP